MTACPKQESAFQDLFFGGLLRMSGSQFQQFNEDLNKMLGSTLPVCIIICILAVCGMVSQPETECGPLQ